MLIILGLSHVPSQCYQYVAFASTESTAKAISALALEQFTHSRDLGRLIVSVIFFGVFLLKIELMNTLFTCFVGLWCLSAKNCHSYRTQEIHGS